MKILLVNPNKWGRGITAIWIASHAAILKKKGHTVEFFDSTFYENWTNNENKFNTYNKQYKKSDYDRMIKFNSNNVYEDLQKTIDNFRPDIIFWSAISSHIHGEGEYVNIQYGYELVNELDTDAILVTGGLQATSSPLLIMRKFLKINFLIMGESEMVLIKLLEAIENNDTINNVKGVVYRDINDKENIKINERQKIINDLSEIGHYDYEIFDEDVFLRPYNGDVVKAIDYEMSRGCVYSCSYCVETVIQRYYGFEQNNKGVIKNASKYLRNKSAEQIIFEITHLHKTKSISLFRCQDTNFLTINRAILNEVAEYLHKSNLDIKLYIETRPEGINKTNIALLKKLKVDGIGMGIEIGAQDFREEKLNRYAKREKIINAFNLLKIAGIKRTAYNIIGLPEETEEQILETIKFNKLIAPDNITVAFYSPYLGTQQQILSTTLNYFENYEFDVDGQLRTVSKHDQISNELLNFYKKYFVDFVRGHEGLVSEYKLKEGLI